jgi:TonB family protein
MTREPRRPSTPARAAPLWPALAAAGILSLNAGAALGQTGSPQTAAPSQAAPDVFHFAIAPQPLSSALEAFVAATHVQVLSDRPAGSEPLSRGVTGAMTAPAALQALVADTGLTVRFTGPKAAILEPAAVASTAEALADPRFAHAQVLTLDDIQVKGAPQIAAASKDTLGYRLYAYRVRQAVWSALRGDPVTASSAYRVAARLWLDSSGRVSRAELMQPSGQAALDAAIGRILRGADARGPPPAGMPLPMEMLLDNRSAP